MKVDLDAVRTSFSNEASTIYMHKVSAFKLRVKKVDRQRDENVFQQISAVCIAEFKQELSQLCRRFLDEFGKDVNSGRLSQELNKQSSYYLAELLHKLRSF